ncbi:MAG: cobalamin-binding protein [Candidatus Omnitrophica bacterium]|nr:cobalamin-binding protein [Candidatus Omnitrophota bacterium]
MRICSLLPTATEMLYALGLSRSVVARSQHCSYPPQVRAKPVVVTSRVKKIAKQDSFAIHQAVLKLQQEGVHQFQIDLPALKRLKPDLVITQNLCSVCAAPHPEVSAVLQHLSPRPRLISINSQRLDEIFTEIRKLGEMTHREKAAIRLTHQLQQRIDRVRQLVSRTSYRPRAWVCEWLEPLMAAGHWIPEMVEVAGGVDGLGVKGKDSIWLNWEQVRRYDPEVIVVMPCSYSISQTLREKKRLTQRPGWKSLSAVKQGRVFALEGSFFHHAGPRLVDGIELLAHLFHPTQVPGNSLCRHYRALT